MTVKFKKWSCSIEKSHYLANKQISIKLMCEESYALVAVATVCLPEYDFKENETAIKDYSENEGMLSAMIEAGIVRDTGIMIDQEWVQIPIVELLTEGK